MALAIALGLMAALVFGLVLIAFLMLVAAVFSMVIASAPRRATPTWQRPRVVTPAARQSDWERRAA